MKLLTPCNLISLYSFTKATKITRNIHNSIVFYYSKMFRHYCVILGKFLHYVLKLVAWHFSHNRSNATTNVCIIKFFTFTCFILTVQIIRCTYNIAIMYSRLYRVSQEEWTKLRESVPYVELYRYNPKHLYPNLNGYGDNSHRKVWASGMSTYCTPSVKPYSSSAHARQRDTAS